MEAMMNTEIFAINLRNILLFQLMATLAFVEIAPFVHHELCRIWKRLKAPSLLIKSIKTNHPSNRFWEIDMTKFEP
jgi:hypothetical protein